MDQCANTEEAQVILEDHTGTSKYFRFAKNMSLPKLHLAIEHNHKEFVGHALCQQVFRRFYEQNVPWHGKSLRFKFLHFVLQILMAPILVVMSLFAWIGKEISSIHGIGKNEPSLYGFKKYYEEDVSWKRSLFNKTIDYLTLNQLSLNVPLNRFLIFSGYYLIFVTILVAAILAKTVYGDGFCFDEYQILLTIFVISMIWQDFSSLSNVRTFKTYFKLWRVYDLIMHMALALALLFRAITEAHFKDDPDTEKYDYYCRGSYHKQPKVNVQTTPALDILTQSVAMNATTTPYSSTNFYTAEVVLFALTATLAIGR